MTIGMLVLVAVAIAIYLGAAQRVLDRLRLTDRAALLFVGAMVVGGFLPDIPLSDNVSINIGGALIPLAFAVYAAMKILPTEPTYNRFLDPFYIFSIIAAVVGYLAGRSRRSAFIAGSMGLLLTDIYSRIEVALRGGSGSMVIGGAGVFDGVVIAGILSLLLAEIFGETRERLQGGPAEDRPSSLRKGLSEGEFSEELSHDENSLTKEENNHEEE